MSALPYVHLATPLILLLPVLMLLPPRPGPPADLPGIIPITIRIVRPRRRVILTALCLLALTSSLDGALLVADLLTAPSRDGQLYLVSSELQIASWIAYALGGFIVWSLAAIVAEWRAKWGAGGITALATLGFVCEVPNLVLLIISLAHTSGGKWKILSVLAIVPSALRLLLLPVLLVAASTPIISYERADENSSLLAPEEETSEQDRPESSATGTYGTFTNGANTGVNTPAGAKGAPVQIPKNLKIPKKLGEGKKPEKEELNWREVLERLRTLAPYLWPSTSRKLQLYVLICILILAAGRVLTPLQPLSLGAVVSALTASQHGSTVSPWPPFFAYFIIRYILSGGLLGFIRQRLWIPVEQYTDREMMLTCFAHILDLSLAYHTKANSGEIMSIIDHGSSINNLFSLVVFTAAPTIFDLVIAIGIFYYLYGIELTSLSFVIMAVYIYVTFIGNKTRSDLRRKYRDAAIKQRRIISDVLTNWESVKYFAAESRESGRFREAMVSFQEVDARWNYDYQLLNLIQYFILALGAVSGAIIIALRVLRGETDASQFIVFTSYYAQLSSPLDAISGLYQQMNRYAIDAEKMFQLLAEPTDIKDAPGAKDLILTDGVIEFDNVHFSYDDKVEALKGVSFKIEKGQSMALVGQSGSGTSTILRLIFRFYDVDSGVIRIDGQDISKVTQKSLRRAIGIVPQDSVLWNDTIGANIAYGKEGASDEDIIQAAQSAQLHDRILTFADSYSTVVGERGLRLSGGEKQRVSLARMFLKSPSILVLDEATSALDTETEREIQRALAILSKGRTSLSIAHRLSTIINSDTIVVMKEGKIVEQGGYKELLGRKGAFQRMWSNQIHTDAEMLGDEEVEQTLIDFDKEVTDAPPTPASGYDVSQSKPTVILGAAIDQPAAAEAGGDTVAEAIVKAAGDDKAADDTHDLAAADAADAAGASGAAGVASYASVVAASAPPESEGVKEETDRSESTEHDVSSDLDLSGRPSTIAEEGSTPSASVGALDPTAQTSQPSAEASTETEAEGGRPEASEAPPKPHVTAAEEGGTTAPDTPADTTHDSSANKTPSESPAKGKEDEDVEETDKDTKAVKPALSSLPSSRSIVSQSDRGSIAGTSSTQTHGEDDSSKSGGKARKRLSSIKGFMRRVSDQGLSRSPSWNSAKGRGPLDSDDGQAAEESAAPASNLARSDSKKKAKDKKK